MRRHLHRRRTSAFRLLDAELKSKAYDANRYTFLPFLNWHVLRKQNNEGKYILFRYNKYLKEVDIDGCIQTHILTHFLYICSLCMFV